MALSKELSQLQCSFDKGEVIFSENELTRDLYVLLKGKIEVLQQGVQLAILDKSGVFFGEMALLTGEKRSATLRVLESAIMLKVAPDQLSILLKNMPDLAMKMAKNLAMTVNHLNKDLLKAWEAMELKNCLERELEKEPQKSLEATLPELFSKVKQKQHENQLEVAKSYLSSNVFTQPFSHAIEKALSPFHDGAVQVHLDNSSDQKTLEKICGVDFMGATTGTFVFMSSNEVLKKIGEKLFGNNATEKMEDDVMMELVQSMMDQVKKMIPGLHMDLSAPEMLNSFQIPEEEFLGIKLNSNVGIIAWVHLNR